MRSVSFSYKRLKLSAPSRRSLSSTISILERYGHYEASSSPIPSERMHCSELDSVRSDERYPLYTGSVGVDFDHIDNSIERDFWKEKLDTGFFKNIFVSELRNSTQVLIQANYFEEWLHTKFVGLKYYGFAGTETLITAVQTILKTSSSDDVVIGQAHRGRLAMFATLFNYPLVQLFKKLGGQDEITSSQFGVDDVSSHIWQQTRVNNKTVHLLPNPSHLEAVNPVAIGFTRALQDAGNESVCVLIHGDSAFSGQGVNYEVACMSTLPGYNTNGTIHIVCDNLVGFTAEARSSRSTNAIGASGMLGRGSGCPIIRVNSEDIGAVIRATEAAVQYRERFHKDVFIEIRGFRRMGHNEVDEPRFTNPLLYKEVDSKGSYAERLGKEVFGASYDSLIMKVKQRLEEAFVDSKKNDQKDSDSASSGLNVAANMHRYISPKAVELLENPRTTSLSMEELIKIGVKSVSLPSSADWKAIVARERGRLTGPQVAYRVGHAHENSVEDDFKVHDRLLRTYIVPRLSSLGISDLNEAQNVLSDDAVLARVVSSLTDNNNVGLIDWATAEALAMGSILESGAAVRGSGQDFVRGTFSHRHAALTCQQSGLNWLPLSTCGRSSTSSNLLRTYSSPLSEYSIAGFEFGYSWAMVGFRGGNSKELLKSDSPSVPSAMPAPISSSERLNALPLTMWEAQFGDFANTAQVIFDNFFSSSEDKWRIPTNMTLLLPHGFDAAGPEHSTARPERWLQYINSPAVGYSSLRSASKKTGPIRDLSKLKALLPAADLPKLLEAAEAAAEPANLIVAQPSTPASYFHLLRRQSVRPAVKPLVVVAPKTLLRLPEARSHLSQLSDGRFEPLIVDELPSVKNQNVHTVILASGRACYTVQDVLADAVKKGEMSPEDRASIVTMRLEEIAPFPSHHLKNAVESVVARNPRVEGIKLVWFQEEPINGGAWSWVRDHLNYAIDGHFLPGEKDLRTQSSSSLDSSHNPLEIIKDVLVVARPALAAPAVGLSKRCKLQASDLNRQLLDALKM